MDSKWREKELSENKPYVVVSVDYMTDGTIRVCVKENGRFGFASGYPDRYDSVKDCELSLIEEALENIEELPYNEKQADLEDYLIN